MTTFLGSQAFIGIIYLIASGLFILALKWMNAPPTARRGILAGEIGMVLAIGGTILQLGVEGKLEHIAISYTWIFIALAIGTAIGVPLGLVQMTAVPQRTALSHAFGAFCVTLVGTSEYYLGIHGSGIPPFKMSVLCMEVILGGLTVTGSLMAAGKLQEVLPQRPITFKGQNLFNLAMLAVSIVIAVYLVLHSASFPDHGWYRPHLWHHAGHPHRRR
jgi:NAD(P) transhydrogenase subunit beta